MNKSDKKTIRKLFPGEYNDVEASVSACDRIGSNIPVFEPSKAKIDRIKAQVAIETHAVRRWGIGLRTACACAALSIILGLTWQILLHSQNNTQVDNSYLAASMFNDASENLLYNRIDIIESSLNIKESNKDSNLENAVLELEIQLKSLNNDFWKG